MASPKQNRIYAIDFGTCNSLLAAASPTAVTNPLPLDPAHHDPSVLRSTMYFSAQNHLTFGQEAIQSYVEESGEGRFVRSIKKFLPSASFTSTHIGGRSYQLEELIGCFLRETKARADAHINADVASVVLGRPARFSLDAVEDQLAQSRLENAARQAGFKHIEFFPEPLAAAFAYRQELKTEKTVLIVDLGAGTSDFTVMRLHPSTYSERDVLSLGGVAVAGDALDGALMRDKVASHFGTEVRYRLPLSQNVLTMPAGIRHRLLSPADITLMARADIREFLTQVERCAVGAGDKESLRNLFNLIEDNLGFAIFEAIEACKRSVCQGDAALFKFHQSEIDIEESVTRLEFAEITSEKVRAIFSSLDAVVSQAGVRPSMIDLVCCTGGTSKVPAVTAGLIERFGEEKIRSMGSFHSVIEGLGQRAQSLL